MRKLKLFYWRCFKREAEHQKSLCEHNCNKRAYEKIIRLANLKIIKLEKMRIRKINPKRPFYIKLVEGHAFLKNDIIIMDRSNTRYLILDNNVKDKKWKKFFRNLRMTKFLLYFGINVHNHTGDVKVKLYKNENGKK